jgi:hypothetical protein
MSMMITYSALHLTINMIPAVVGVRSMPWLVLRCVSATHAAILCKFSPCAGGRSHAVQHSSCKQHRGGE